jgi:hypothetical protein
VKLWTERERGTAHRRRSDMAPEKGEAERERKERDPDRRQTAGGWNDDGAEERTPLGQKGKLRSDGNDSGGG